MATSLTSACVDCNGKEAVPGQSVGTWLTDDDFLCTEDIAVLEMGKLGFPRDWPAVYSSSKVLKSLIGKKGRCAGKKVSVVPPASAEDRASVENVRLHRLNSFSNATMIAEATGMSVVRGWAVFELLDKAVSAAFVAERYWWNAGTDGRWIDFSPRPKGWSELLLAEAAGDSSSKTEAQLTLAQVELARFLLRERFIAEDEANTRSTSDVQRLLAGVVAGDAELTRQLAEKLREDENLAIVIAGQIAKPLVDHLQDGSGVAQRDAALELLAELSDAAVSENSTDIQACLIKAGTLVPLIGFIELSWAAFPVVQQRAAAVIGNLCHESHEHQNTIAQAGALPPLVALISSVETGPALEAAYAVWNITVGHRENSAAVTKLGAVPKLVALLKNSNGTAQENAAGALMHITMCEEARVIIMEEAGAITRLCELLQPRFEAEVRCQAAGALLNLASDSPQYAKVIAKEGAIGPLVSLVKDGSGVTQEYAAGAIMNLIRSDAEAAGKAAQDGAIPALAALLSKSSGHAEALGALANLASGNTERQASIFKVQVTRKSVVLLSDRNVEVRRGAAALLMNLATHAKIKERIVEANALTPLCKCLEDVDEAVRERATGALANLFNDHPANVKAGFEQVPGMINSLITILKDIGLSREAKRQAGHALAMLAAEDGSCDAVWTAGAGKPFLVLLKDMVAEAALGIMNLAWRWPEVKEELALGGAVEDLTVMVTNGEAIAKEYAAGALMNMTAASKEIAQMASPAVPALVSLLQQDAIQAAEWSAGALGNIAKASPELRQEVASADAVPSLARLLSTATPGGRSLIVLALNSLAEDDGQATVLNALGTKEKQKLREFIEDGGSEELREYTDAFIRQLGDDFSL
eukprot:TRINITY_DN8198_c0_g3_i1.p1 TRINITY_DN8198_c0_g3~~TRINITY_DN8198_c0_g3_i1.p1  ORF type:complete len:872 (-),score=167.63 TRINITY_DN8198_c0_g3_i1:87-2702(-)